MSARNKGRKADKRLRNLRSLFDRNRLVMNGEGRRHMYMLRRDFEKAAPGLMIEAHLRRGRGFNQKKRALKHRGMN